MARNALILLDAVAGSAFVWLTDKGNLQRETVAAMRSAMSWPGMESVEDFRKGKALREEDVGELHLLHRLLHKAVLVEGDIALLRLTPLGGKMLEPGIKGHAAGATVPLRLLGDGSLPICERAPPGACRGGGRRAISARPSGRSRPSRRTGRASMHSRHSAQFRTILCRRRAGIRRRRFRRR